MRVGAAAGLLLLLACWALAIVDHIGGSDPIHALKSGFVIPFLVVAVGIPFLAVAPDPRDTGQLTGSGTKR